MRTEQVERGSQPCHASEENADYLECQSLAKWWRWRVFSFHNFGKNAAKDVPGELHRHFLTNSHGHWPVGEVWQTRPHKVQATAKLADKEDRLLMGCPVLCYNRKGCSKKPHPCEQPTEMVRPGTVRLDPSRGLTQPSGAAVKITPQLSGHRIYANYGQGLEAVGSQMG